MKCRRFGVAPIGAICGRERGKRSPVGSQREARVLEHVPLHRVGTPAEIAHVICMLLAEDAGYLTGQIVRVDGGGSIGAA
jgi:NAD(P)-dependent dehydrogenase (short-subunit alcohol dehydrogenase family)